MQNETKVLIKSIFSDYWDKFIGYIFRNETEFRRRLWHKVDDDTNQLFSGRQSRWRSAFGWWRVAKTEANRHGWNQFLKISKSLKKSILHSVAPISPDNILNGQKQLISEKKRLEIQPCPLLVFIQFLFQLYSDL